MNIIAQYAHFIKESKTLEDLDRLDFRLWRVYDGRVPEELKKEIEKRRNELTTK